MISLVDEYSISYTPNIILTCSKNNIFTSCHGIYHLTFYIIPCACLKNNVFTSYHVYSYKIGVGMFIN